MAIHLGTLSIVKNWNAVVKNGAWDNKAGTAGGCRNFPTFVENTQYVIELAEDADGDGKCSCLIALMQKHRRKQKKMGVQDLCIGFSVYKVSACGMYMELVYIARWVCICSLLVMVAMC